MPRSAAELAVAALQEPAGLVSAAERVKTMSRRGKAPAPLARPLAALAEVMLQEPTTVDEIQQRLANQEIQSAQRGGSSAQPATAVVVVALASIRVKPSSKRSAKDHADSVVAVPIVPPEQTTGSPLPDDATAPLALQQTGSLAAAVSPANVVNGKAKKPRRAKMAALPAEAVKLEDGTVAPLVTVPAAHGAAAAAPEAGQARTMAPRRPSYKRVKTEGFAGALATAKAASVKASVEFVASEPAGTLAAAEVLIPAAAAAAQPKPKRRRTAAIVTVEQGMEDAAAANALADEAGVGEAKPKRKRASRKPKKEDDAAEEGKAVGGAGEEEGEEEKPQRKRAPRKAKKEEGAGEDADVEAEAAVAVMKQKRVKREKPPPYDHPGPEALAAALQQVMPPLPVPNLGYACLNATLRALKPPVFTNRDCVQKTLLEKGLDYISELALQNCRELPAILRWNHEHGIRLFRLSSCFFPWCTEYNLDQLKGFPAIAEALRFAGDLARAYDQRLTFHPSHFIKLCGQEEDLVRKSIHELEVHSQIFDLMGYPPSHYNKINIHIGGVYGDKAAALARFETNYRRLSPNLKNDDRPNDYSIADLLPLSKATGIPLVFDFHHHKFCPGDMTEKEAMHAALATWPEGVRPVVHWSESQEGRKAHAHSDYVDGPIALHGWEGKIDVIIEAKAKELALLRYRDISANPGPKSEALKFL